MNSGDSKWTLDSQYVGLVAVGRQIIRVVMYLIASWFLPTFFGSYRSECVVVNPIQRKTPQSCACVARFHAYVGIVDVGKRVFSPPTGPHDWLRDPTRAEAMRM